MPLFFTYLLRELFEIVYKLLKVVVYANVIMENNYVVMFAPVEHRWNAGLWRVLVKLHMRYNAICDGYVAGGYSTLHC